MPILIKTVNDIQIVTVNLPNIYVDAIAKIVRSGKYPTRSEAIRSALRKFLGVEFALAESMIIASEKPDPLPDTPTDNPEPKIKPTKIDMRRIRAGWS